MKKILIAAVALVFTFFVFAIACNTDDFRDGFEDGYNSNQTTEARAQITEIPLIDAPEPDEFAHPERGYDDTLSEDELRELSYLIVLISNGMSEEQALFLLDEDIPQRTCDILHQGVSVPEFVLTISNQSGVSMSDVALSTGAAIGGWCPELEHLLD